MAWGIKYRIEFDDQRELNWRIQIYEDEFSGDITDLIATGNPLIFYHDNDSDELFDPIRPSFANIECYSETNFPLLDLVSMEEKKFLLNIYQDDSIYWHGFIEPGSYQEMYDQPPYPVKIVAGDGLNYLKTIKYEQQDGSAYSGRKTEIAILRDIFEKVDSTFMNFEEYVNIFETSMTQDNDHSPMEYIQIDTMLFEGMMCYEVLQHILSKYNAVIRQYNALYNIFRPTELSGSTVTVYGRRWIGDTTKSTVSYQPLQYINRSTTPTNLQQVPGGYLMMERPVNEVKVIHDYGYRDSMLNNHKFLSNNFIDTGNDTYDVPNWTEVNLPYPKPASMVIPGIDEGICLLGLNNEEDANDWSTYITQAFAIYAPADMSDTIDFSFDYIYSNNSTSTIHDALIKIVIKDHLGDYHLEQSTTDDNQLVWNPYYQDIRIAIPDLPPGSSGWQSYRKKIITIPGLFVNLSAPFLIEIYAKKGTIAAHDIGLKNIKISAISDYVTLNKIKRPTYYNIYWRGRVAADAWAAKKYPRTTSFDVKDEIVSKEYIFNNDIKAPSLEVGYLLGDVIDSNMDLILDNFRGALSIAGVPTSTWTYFEDFTQVPLLELIGKEIALQKCKPQHVIQMPLIEKSQTQELNIIGSFRDDLLPNHIYMMNRGSYDVKNRIWDVDMAEILYASLRINSVTLSPIEVEPEDALSAKVMVENTGNAPTSKRYRWLLYSSSWILMSSGYSFTGIIAPGEIKEVTVPGTTAPSTEGDYRIGVNFKDYNYVLSNYITVTVGEFLSISPTLVNTSYAATTETLTITSNVDWTVEERSAYSWITLGTTSGSNNGTCDVSIAKNTGSSSRTAYIDVDGTGVTTKTLTITQAGCPAPACSISLCEDDEPGYLSGTSCSVTSGSETVSFSFTPYDITGPGAITGVVTVSGSQSASESLSFRDGFETSSTITLPNNVQYGEYYFITICSVIPM